MMDLVSPRRSDRVVNLCFHGIGSPGRPLEAGEAQYWVDVGQFEDLLDVIRRYPFFRITLDDGNASDIAHALPALLRYGLRATFFVLASRLDQVGSLSSREVRSLLGYGMTIGSHGMHHRPWRSLCSESLRVELVDATEIIASVARTQISEVAFPFGSYGRRVLNAARRVGFRHVYTVDGKGRVSPDAWLQSRYTIESQHNPRDIERLAREVQTSAFSSAVRASKLFVKRWR
jgi:peptidoglycan/xylan/chitin deacetylase (PgdA/CDA1 family)